MKKRENEKKYFGKRLMVARKMLGLSMDDLVEKTGDRVTKQAISKYERGLMYPSSAVLISLSHALDVKPDFFFRTSNVQLKQLHFRRQSDIPKKEQESIRFQAIEFLERYTELENILGQEKIFSNPLKNIKIKNEKDAERAAWELRKQWNLGISPIMNLLNLLEKMGIKIMLIEHDENLDGLSGGEADSPIIILNSKKPTDRMRFTAAHELAHIMFPDLDESQCEVLCHAFANAFLLPREVLEQELITTRKQVTFWELGIIKQNFGISVQAILRRTRSLDIINENHFQIMMKIMKRQNWTIKEPVAFIGREEPLHLYQLLNYALSEGIIGEGKAADLAKKTAYEFRKMYIEEWTK